MTRSRGGLATRLTWWAVTGSVAAILVACDSSGRPSPDRSSPVAEVTRVRPPVTTGPSVSPRVRLDVGHCWIEQVAFDGETWGVPLARQFGTGGSFPGGWEGMGTMTRVDERTARYVDGGGTVVVFRPAWEPEVRIVESKGCA